MLKISSGFIITLMLFVFGFMNISDSKGSISGVVHIGTGMQYTSLTKNGGLFAAINADTVSGDIIAMIATNLEENAANQLNQWVESGIGNYRLYIVPVDTATVVKKITGYTNSSVVNFITLHGADRVIIDGSLNQSGRFLRFMAINNSLGGVFKFRNAATHDTIRNCIIEAGANSSVNTIVFENNNVAGGNSYNEVSGNIIRDNPDIATAQVDYAISSISAGDTFSMNRNNTIYNNEIFNFKSAGVKVYNGSGFTITDNSFYYNAAQTYTVQLCGVEISGGNGHRIAGNYIGGSGPSCSGAPWTCNNTGFFGIRFINSFQGQPTTIVNNTIQNLALSGGYLQIGIYIYGTANIDSISGNMIGSATDSASVFFPQDADFAGIRLDYGGGTVKHVTDNTIANILADAASCGSIFAGIKIDATSNQQDTLNVSRNQIYKMYSKMSCTALEPIFCGIDNRADLLRTKFSGNVIHDLWKIGTGQYTDEVSGFYFKNNNAGGLIEKNRIYGLYNVSYSSVIQAIALSGGAWTIRNNFLSLSNGDLTNLLTIYGIRHINNSK